MVEARCMVSEATTEPLFYRTMDRSAQTVQGAKNGGDNKLKKNLQVLLILSKMTETTTVIRPVPPAEAYAHSQEIPCIACGCC